MTSTSEAGFSDHKLVLAYLTTDQTQSEVQQYKYHNIKMLNTGTFMSALCTRDVLQSPADDVELL